LNDAVRWRETRSAAQDPSPSIPVIGAITEDLAEPATTRFRPGSSKISRRPARCPKTPLCWRRSAAVVRGRWSDRRPTAISHTIAPRRVGSGA
jgi:hypothetical protein